MEGRGGRQKNCPDNPRAWILMPDGDTRELEDRHPSQAQVKQLQ